MPATPGGISTMDGENLLDAFNINVVSTHRMTAALIPALQSSKVKKIIMV
jgi:short-subunit dehydrogenase